MLRSNSQEAIVSGSNGGKKYIVLLVLYIALKPVYLFESGGIQICDAVMMIAIVLNAISSRGKTQIRMADSSFYLVLISLVAYQFLVNMIWYVFYSDSRLLLSSAFYVYNVLGFFCFVDIARKYGVDSFKRSIVAGIVISEAVTIIGIVLNRGTNERAVGFFNNPNQLGLYGLLMITLLFFTIKYTNRILRYWIVGIAVMLIILSASKAALLALFVFAFFYVLFVDENTSKYSRVRKIISVVLVAILVYMFFYSNLSIIITNRSIMYMRLRLLNMNREVDSNLATGRGYARIMEMGHNILWGMGEGAYERFKIMPDHEVHSMVASIIVSYGIIGAMGYAFIFVFLIKDRGKTLFNIAGISGVFLYSITHNCIRNTLLWMIFALLFINKEEKLE